MRGLRRDRALPLAALACGLVGLASAALASAPAPLRTTVVMVARAVPAGRPIAPGSLRLARIDAGDAGVGMLHSITDAAYRRPLVGLHAGEYLSRSELGSDGGLVALHRGQRAVSLRLDPTVSPPLTLLGQGARVDVVVSADADRSHPSRSVVVASDIELLTGARAVGDGLVVTVRATLRQAVALTAAQSYAHDLRLLVRSPGDRGGSAGVTVDASALGSGGRP